MVYIWILIFIVSSVSWTSQHLFVRHRFSELNSFITETSTKSVFVSDIRSAPLFRIYSLNSVTSNIVMEVHMRLLDER